MSSRLRHYAAFQQGVVPSNETIADMCEARDKEQSEYQQFVGERLEGRPKYFFLSTLKLKSFQTNKTSIGNEIILNSDKNLFSVMKIVVHSRRLDMKEVVGHPIGPVPWALSTADNSLRKTNKATLSKEPEQLSVPADTLPENVVTIIDAMSVVQRIKGAQKT